MRKILIIDDDVITLQIMKHHLQEQYEVQIENAGYRFIKKIDEYEADLILLDIEMPIMNGLDVFDQLKKDEKKKEVPVVFLTGVADPQVVMELMNKGAAGYIVKTAAKDEILSKIKKILFTNL